MKPFIYCQAEIEGCEECNEQCNHCKEYYAPLAAQVKENGIKELIRQGITQHLVVQNPKGIDYAVNTIYKLLNPQTK